MRDRSDQAGFSLLELLIVVVVLGIVSGVVVFAVGNSGDGETVARCEADVGTSPSGDTSRAKPSDCAPRQLALTPGATAQLIRAVGTSTPTRGPDFEVVIEFTVLDQDDHPVDGADVVGQWSDGNPHDSCTTDSTGTCRIEGGTHTTADPNELVVWTFDSLAAPDHDIGATHVTSVSCSRTLPDCGTLL